MTLTIGTDAEIYDYSVKQKGYGRQGLYVTLYRTDGSAEYVKNVYIMDVFPNISEHFDQYILQENAFFNEEEGYYTNDNGNGQYSEDEVFSTTLEMLNHALKSTEVEIEEEDEDEDEE